MMSTLFRAEEEPSVTQDERVVICAGLDPAGVRWAVPAAVARASQAGLPILVYVHADESRAWACGETIAALAGFPSIDPMVAAADEVLALAGDWADRVRCVAVRDRGRIADLIEAVIAEGACEAVFVGFASHDALPVGCRVCAEAEAECEAVLMPFDPR